MKEWFCIQVKETTNTWKGDLSLGFTNQDPSSLARPLPKCACPDLAGEVGFWAKQLPVKDKDLTKDTCVHICLEQRFNNLNLMNISGELIRGSRYRTEGFQGEQNQSVSQRACLLDTTHSGKVRWWLNEKEKGVLLRGVDTRTDLWAMVDLYGKCNRIQITNTCQQRDYTQSSQQPGAVPLVNQGQGGGYPPQQSYPHQQNYPPQQQYRPYGGEQPPPNPGPLDASGSECAVCMEPFQQKQAFNPCGHANCCQNCIVRVMRGNEPRCPSCREPIQNVLRLFP